MLTCGVEWRTAMNDTRCKMHHANGSRVDNHIR
jgi:hypothetical protein